jgi:hypothetical protein
MISPLSSVEEARGAYGSAYSGAYPGRGQPSSRLGMPLGRPYANNFLLLAELLGYKEFIPTNGKNNTENQRIRVKPGTQGQPPTYQIPNLTFDQNRNPQQRIMLLNSRSLFAAYMANKYVHNPNLYDETLDPARGLAGIRFWNYIHDTQERKWIYGDGIRRSVSDLFGWKIRHFTLHPEEWIFKEYAKDWRGFQEWQYKLTQPISGVSEGEEGREDGRGGPRPTGGAPRGSGAPGQGGPSLASRIFNAVIRAPRYVFDAGFGTDYRLGGRPQSD